ncbi:hypothetical protein N9Z12_05225 [Opitutaceae bacterium]|nr:hypothetical protein [Opitutaceae bacterium]
MPGPSGPILGGLNSSPPITIAPFRFDVTPPLGHALLGGLVPPARAIDDELEAIGYVLLTDDAPIVVCVLDWAGLMNSSHRRFREALANAAHTTPDRVALHCVHQHNTPFVCEDTQQWLEPGAVFDPGFFESCLTRAVDAIAATLKNPIAITHVASGRAVVQNVASNRRVDRDERNQVRSMRGSSCDDPELIALPEGLIDPDLQTLAYYSGTQKIVSCHTYATHPMSFYRDGRVTSDFCGLARKQRQTEEPDCTHLYFTGCAGNIAAGKYNDGSAAARTALTQRMYAAIVASESKLRPEPLQSVAWRTIEALPESRDTATVEELGATVGGAEAPRIGKILHAYWRSWAGRTQRGEPLELSALHLNDITQLHLPGEPFLEYQLHAQSLRPGSPVITIGYGDGGPWYIPTSDELPLGGYETTVAFSKPSIDDQLRGAIQRLLAVE